MADVNSILALAERSIQQYGRNVTIRIIDRVFDATTQTTTDTNTDEVVKAFKKTEKVNRNVDGGKLDWNTSVYVKADDLTALPKNVDKVLLDGVAYDVVDRNIYEVAGVNILYVFMISI